MQKDKKVSSQIELERWWIAKITDLPFNLKKFPNSKIKQAYISYTPIVRVRSVDGKKFILCLKSRTIKQSKGSHETEIKIESDSFKALMKHSVGKIISKVRYEYLYQFKNKKYKVEIDHFSNTQNVVKPYEVKIEVEFTSVKDYTEFVAPSWFGKEVTDNKKYSNSSISKS